MWTMLDQSVDAFAKMSRAHQNGADFVLAFEAGASLKLLGAHTVQADEAPTIVVVTADAGLSVIADELQQCGFQCKVVKDMEGLAICCAP